MVKNRKERVCDHPTTPCHLLWPENPPSYTFVGCTSSLRCRQPSARTRSIDAGFITCSKTFHTNNEVTKELAHSSFSNSTPIYRPFQIDPGPLREKNGSKKRKNSCPFGDWNLTKEERNSSSPPQVPSRGYRSPPYLEFPGISSQRFLLFSSLVRTTCRGDHGDTLGKV